MATKKAAKAATLTVKLTKSLIGSTKKQIAVVESLGLHKVGDTSAQPDNAQTAGKIKAIGHLVEVQKA